MVPGLGERWHSGDTTVEWNRGPVTPAGLFGAVSQPQCHGLGQAEINDLGHPRFASRLLVESGGTERFALASQLRLVCPIFLTVFVVPTQEACQNCVVDFLANQ
jgi:hypothetical protein